MSERRYDDEEVGLILRRAVEAGEKPAEADGNEPGQGLTLSELQEIGAEAGIDAAKIDEAASWLARTPGQQSVAHRGLSGRLAAARTAIGMPPTVQMERLVPVPLDPDRLPDLLDVIRTEFARQGIVEEVLGGFEWRASDELGGRYVSIRPEGEHTRIRALGNYRNGLMVMGFGVGPISAAAIGALVAAFGVATPFVVVPAALIGGVTAAVAPWKYLWGRQRRSLRRVMDELERRLTG